MLAVTPKTPDNELVDRSIVLRMRSMTPRKHIVKKLRLCPVALTGLLSAPLRAGTETYKQVAPPPPPPMYGLGFYGAIDMGANVYQNRGGNRTISQTDPDRP